MTHPPISLAYGDTGGSGPALILVHGHPFDRTMWAPQTEYFRERGWRVITPELRGYGQSPATPGVVTLETHASDIMHLLDRLEIGRAVFGGLSMGGQIVMELHHGFAERFCGMILADTSAPAETREGRIRRNTTADRLLAEGMEGYAREVISSMLAPRTIDEQPAVAAQVMAMMLATPPAGAAAALRGRAERRDFSEMLSQVLIPTLVVVGSDDVFTPIADARYLHERIPGSSISIIKGAGHMPNLEFPDLFNEQAEGFLTTVKLTK